MAKSLTLRSRGYWPIQKMVLDFEKYLKSSSGFAFRNTRLVKC